MTANWDTYLTDADRAVLEVSGYGAAGPLPQRPALLVIDVTYDFCGPEGADRVAAARACRTACGPAAWAAVAQIAPLLAAARDGGAPVIFTRRDPARLAQRRRKSARSGEDDPAGNEIVAPIAPAPGEPVIGKTKPSAFWRTDLAERLAQWGCDGVVLTGGTTSGCVRATAVDAFNHNLSVLLVAEAVFDRFDASHAMSLFDLQAKYADLVDGTAAARLLGEAYHESNPRSSNSTPR